MEFTVSKSDLVRELNLSQGVVEKKTTIPILSNVLLEAVGESLMLTATDLELGVRCHAPAKVKSGGAGTIPAKKLLDYVRLLPDAEIHDRVHGEPLGEPDLRSLKDPDRRHVAGELPGTAADAGSPGGDSDRRAGGDDLENDLLDLGRGIRFTLNGALLSIKGKVLTMVATDGHRLVHGGERESVGLRGCVVQGAAAAEGDERVAQAGLR